MYITEIFSIMCGLAASTINSALKDILNMKNGIFEVKRASIVQGYRMLIEEFEVIEDTFEDEIVLNESLEFLDKSFYAEVFKNKGRLNNQGQKVPNHPLKYRNLKRIFNDLLVCSLCVVYIYS